MDLTTYVNHLGREIAALAEVNGDESRALIERLTGSLESAIRMTLLDALSGAADEITRELAPGSVEVRLRGRDPSFVVSAPPGVVADDVTPAAEPAVTEPAVTEDGPAARINVRMPEPLKAAIEEAAAREGRSVNAWLVRAAAAGLQQSDRRSGPDAGGVTKRSAQRLTGWVR